MQYGGGGLEMDERKREKEKNHSLMGKMFYASSFSSRASKGGTTTVFPLMYPMG